MPENFKITHGLLRLPKVLALIGVSRSTLYRWVALGQFPRPRALTPTGSTVAWSAAEVHAWIAAKLAINDGTFVGTCTEARAQAA
jgi:prophage regulatory protein